jgi:glycosyltransferase involved in cell wall biosynthesis
MTDVMDYPNTYFANTKEEFYNYLDTIIEDNNISKIENFIMNNSWGTRLDKIYEIIKYKLKPKFSIIILCYNNKNIISRCIDSFLKVQNIINSEIIVIDNNSNDGSYDYLLEKYENKIKLLKNTKNGCSSGRNLGIKNISTDTTYVCFFDSDQWITSASCFFEADYIFRTNKDNIGAISWGAGFFDNEDLGGRIAEYLEKKGTLNKEYNDKGYRTDFNYLATCGLFIKKYTINNYNLYFDEFYDPTCFEDTDFAFQIKSKNLKLAFRYFSGIMHKAHQTTNANNNENNFYKKLFLKNSNYLKKKWNYKTTS